MPSGVPNCPAPVMNLIVKRTLLSLLLAAPCAGQLPPILPGTRVRVEAPGQVKEEVKGTLTTQTADSLTIAGVGETRTTVPSAAVSRIDWSQGKSTAAGA